VHARLALLGLDNRNTHAMEDATGGDQQDQQGYEDPTSLWIPAKESAASKTTIKIDHRRAQYRAKQKARQATIENRSIPPLHPRVVTEIARDFSLFADASYGYPAIQVVTNGGIQSLEDVRERIRSDETSHVHGAMVGRAAINHPCAFGNVDVDLYGDSSSRPRTRRGVLDQYIRYCDWQEEEYQQRIGSTQAESCPNKKIAGLCALRQKLVAPAFHLMVGEEGNAAYQRLLKKLVSRAQRHPSGQMLMAAMAHLPSHTLDKCCDTHKPWHVVTQEFQDTHGKSAGVGTKRAGAMQRIIY